VNLIFPNANLSPGAYALVAMGAVFGAASRATFTFIVFAFEITHDFHSILPLMLVSVIADAIALRYLPSSIMTEKLSRRGLDVHQEFEADILKQVRVRDLMRKGVTSILPETTVHELGDRIARGDLSLNLTRGLPVVTKEGELMGLLTQGDLLRALEKNPAGEMSVLEASAKSLFVAYPDERAFDAVFRMLQHNVGRLPVVERSNSKKMVGYLNRSSILGAWTRQFEEEHVRDKGWLNRFFPRERATHEPESRTLTGQIVSLDETSLKIAFGGDAGIRTMEFDLDERPRGISIGDQVRITYHAENDRAILDQIEELRVH
ncbi:MAG TPA: CBS domain-containing protein, partial [Candidatus Acidoferrales bacterium]|nr:CBS domain-containing protein [Candidatus Acidoferrales bacterium]